VSWYTRRCDSQILFVGQVAGQKQIEESVAGFFSTIGGLKHAIVGVCSGASEGGAVISVETTVTYRRKGATVTEAVPHMHRRLIRLKL